MMKKFTWLLGLVFPVLVNSQEVYNFKELYLIPRPSEIKMGKGSLTLKQPIGFIYNDGVPAGYGVSFFKDYLKEYYRISEFKEGSEHSYGFATEIFVDYEKDFPQKEGYELTVNAKGITVRGNDRGLFYAFQTIIQMLPVSATNSKLQIPYATIKDQPRFAYRGMHLDVARHFFPVSFVKRYIDYLALHKFNTFHWHLTDDQGWRIEIKKYPNLTKIGAWRNGTIIARYPGTGNDGIRYGGYYTQEEIKDVVAYAKKRFITIIPEIEMPGHSSAAIASYPELSCFPNESTRHPKQCAWNGDSTGKQVQQTWGIFEDVFCAGKDNTFNFLQDVLDEVMALFPSTYIHVGGDECPKTSWKRCPNCQQRIRDNKLKDEHELQSYFIQRIEKHLNSKGRKLIGWDEILEGGLAPNAAVMSWRGEKGGIDAARQDHDVVMTPGAWCYFDHSQTQNEDSIVFGGYTPIDKVYGYEPVPPGLNATQAKHILGAQANVWTEYMLNPKKVEYQVFPRMSALSEVLWSPKEKRNWKDFEKRLMIQFKRYDLWKANYSRAIFDLHSSILPTTNYTGIRWSVANKYSLGATSFSQKLHLDKPDTFFVYDKKKIDKIVGKDTTSIRYIPLVRYSNKNPEQIIITKSGIYKVESYPVHAPFGFELIRDRSFPIQVIEQEFHFNKATGKKITLANPASDNYPGDGAFTLVNGIHNSQGLTRGREFLGFLGTDCEAMIDLGSVQTISTVKVHILNQTASWIWRPQYAEAFAATDTVNFNSAGLTDDVNTDSGNGIMEIKFTPRKARYVKVKVANWGVIPEGNPGAGTKPWLFVDEIEID